MTLFGFTVTVEGVDVTTDAAQDALYNAGCADATVGVVGDVQTVDFDREAATFGDAVGSAIRSIESAVPSIRVTDVMRAPADVSREPPHAGRRVSHEGFRGSPLG